MQGRGAGLQTGSGPGFHGHCRFSSWWVPRGKWRLPADLCLHPRSSVPPGSAPPRPRRSPTARGIARPVGASRGSGERGLDARLPPVGVARCLSATKLPICPIAALQTCQAAIGGGRWPSGATPDHRSPITATEPITQQSCRRRRSHLDRLPVSAAPRRQAIRCRGPQPGATEPLLGRVG